MIRLLRSARPGRKWTKETTKKTSPRPALHDSIRLFTRRSNRSNKREVPRLSNDHFLGTQASRVARVRVACVYDRKLRVTPFIEAAPLWRTSRGQLEPGRKKKTTLRKRQDVVARNHRGEDISRGRWKTNSAELTGRPVGTPLGGGEGSSRRETSHFAFKTARRSEDKLSLAPL